MDKYLQSKRKLQYRAEILEETIRELEISGATEEAAVARWRAHLGGLHESLQDPFLKIAVIGSVKSGKSTLINAMVGDDLLKRGAGIITAFITRVVSGEGEGGWVELKSWQRVNDEVNASLRMLPVFTASGNEEDLDIREPEDRSRIADWLDRMKFEWLQSRGNIDPNFMFLERCLQGFSLIQDEIGDEINRTELGKTTLPRHQLYAGEESRSVYVRDIELHFPIAWLGDRIELADCQGSDSPNPSHFELLQQYLLASHFIIYVISSRTGLREADFKLLDLVKGLRMFPQTLFVLNLDFDIHNDKDDLENITERVRSELSWVVPDPRLFAFSGLFHLLRQLGEKAPKFERRRMKFWKEARALSKTSDAGYAAFKKELADRICTRRSEVLLGCGLSRLGMIAANIRDTVHVRKSMLEKGMDGARETAGQLRSRHLALQSTLQGLVDTVSGLNQSIKRDLNTKVDGHLDLARGAIVREALDIVDHYSADSKIACPISDYGRLIREYYVFYLEFRRNLSRYLIEKINLRIVEFAKEEEFLLKERIRESSNGLWAFFDAALSDYRRDILGADLPATARQSTCTPNLTTLIAPPCFSSFLERDGLGRGILFLKFGLGSLPGILSGIKAKMRGGGAGPDKTDESVQGSEKRPEDDLFEKALGKARKEAKSELLRAFADFRENIKSTYFYRIVDEGSIFLLNEFRTRAEMAQVDFADMLEQNELVGEERQSAVEALVRASQMTTAMMEELDELRRTIQAGIEDRVEDSSQQAPALPE
jgi:GTPase SAR1 family protein